MVAFSTNDLPASINTVEAVAAWATAVLTRLHFQQEVQEVSNQVQKVAVSQVFPVELNEQYQLRYVGRVSLPMNLDYMGGGKVWQRVLPLSNASIPADFTFDD